MFDVNTNMKDDILDNINVGTVNDHEVNELVQQYDVGKAHRLEEMMFDFISSIEEILSCFIEGT